MSFVNYVSLARADHLSILSGLVVLGEILLENDSRVVENLAYAVNIDRITLQFELLGDDIEQAWVSLIIDQRSRQWLVQLLQDVEDVMDIFRCLGPENPLPAEK